LAEWVRQASIGIARVHYHRLIHVDIKAGNLFRDADNPETMAPEVPTSQATNVRTDVYSLGATLYHLLAGDWMSPGLRTLANWTELTTAVAAHGAPTSPKASGKSSCRP
jgi:serine/threonine protein kinase